MKLGVSLPVFTADPSRPLEVAARAAALGIDGVFSPDHLFPPVPASGAGRPALEAFALLSAVAARNPGLAVGTLVARVGLRPPGILAKQAAALGEMSGGRAILGLGSGDRASAPEHERFGLPFPPARERLALLEETVRAVRALFAGEAWTGGEMVPPMAGPLLPPGAPEIWVGGLSNAAVGIAARRADAWNGWGLSAGTFATKVERLREAAGDREVVPTWGGIAVVGEDASDLRGLLEDRERRGLPSEGVWTGTAGELRGFAEEIEAAGAAWFVVLPAGPADRLDLIVETLRP
ncbi:MAG: LLM class flavin-dependent oxidoreductase [Actinobacteria bacterium]|nr:LLM class flavin-dependent oxidoreductase [Actinomycetota bacterium]